MASVFNFSSVLSYPQEQSSHDAGQMVRPGKMAQLCIGSFHTRKVICHSKQHIFQDSFETGLWRIYYLPHKLQMLGYKRTLHMWRTGSMKLGMHPIPS